MKLRREPELLRGRRCHPCGGAFSPTMATRRMVEGRPRSCISNTPARCSSRRRWSSAGLVSLMSNHVCGIDPEVVEDAEGIGAHGLEIDGPVPVPVCPCPCCSTAITGRRAVRRGISSRTSS